MVAEDEGAARFEVSEDPTKTLEVVGAWPADPERVTDEDRAVATSEAELTDGLGGERRVQASGRCELVRLREHVG